MEITTGQFQKSQFSIRTSDRRTFRRCLRKWDFQSSLRQNLQHAGTEQNINFWFGSAIHFCMEDYHGYNKFGDPRRALYAYFNAFDEDDRPLGADTHYSLGIDMLTYYMSWMERHNQQTGFETAWINPQTYEPMAPGSEGAVPAVEVSFYYPLNVYAIVDVDEDRIIDAFYYDGVNPCNFMPGFKNIAAVAHLMPEQWYSSSDPETIYNVGDRRIRIVGINYHGTIDRIVIDRYGRYWLWDYKTAKSADTAKLATDDQVTAYLLAARKLFPFPVYGFVYLQLTKDRVQQPKRLKNGNLSVDKRQKTTYGLVRQAVIDDYGSVQAAPASIVEFVNYMASSEEPEGDRFIRWDFVKRTDAQLDNHSRAIYGELSLMLNPQLYCFPTPTRDCSWDCPMRDACILMDQNDDDALSEFMMNFEKRPHTDDGNADAWRDAIDWTSPASMAIEDIIGFDATLNIDFGDEGPEDGFKFYYEEDC